MKFRGDIQGARGIGVLIILLAHVGVSQLHGGYVLVDLFFAVSGFVITSMLIAEHKHRLSQGQHGFSLLGFYLRRLKRIFPIATVGIVTTVLLAYLIWNQVAAKKVLNDGIWAFFSLANFHEISKATDYFAQNATHSPLQHYWTLAVEEQFYLLWPLLMLIALRLAGRTRDWRTSGLLVITPVFVASLAYSIYFSSQNPAAAYFSTFTHAWELAAGAMMAFACEYPRFVAWFTPPLRVSVIFISGWVVVLGTAFVLPTGISYPGAVALIPILATLAVLACGAADGSGVMSLVDNKLLRYFGDISFSLYVFHWPVVVFTKILLPTLAPGILKVVQVSVAVAVAALAYAFIERPLRGLVIGIPRAAREDFRAKRRELERATRKQAVRALAWTACASLIALTMALQFTAADSPSTAAGKLIAPEVAHQNATQVAKAGADGSGGAGSLLDGIVAAQDPRVADWLRSLKESAGNFSAVATARQRKSFANSKFAWDKSGWSCLELNDDICMVGSRSAQTKILMVGDSHALQFADGLKKFAADNPTVSITLAARLMCPFSLDPAVQYPRSPQNQVANIAACATLHTDFARGLAAVDHFDLAVISDASARAVGAQGAPPSQVDALTRIHNSLPVSVAKLRAVSKSVVMLNTLIGWGAPLDCLVNDLSNWRTCSAEPTTATANATSYNNVAASVDVPVLHLAPLLCTSVICPLFHGEVAVTPDGAHTSQELSLTLVPVLLRQLQSLQKA